VSALIDKYSPVNWDDIVGQDWIVKFFKSIIQNPEKFPRNFILNGARGTGKTSIARIFVNELNKKYKSFSYEFDVSILNKDSIKDIKDRIDNVFSFSNDYRILIFDEIQTSSSSAQSVFLKTLENNIFDDKIDRKIYFFFLTTDSSKIIDTIHSRCIELDFLLISDEDIEKRLKYIIEKENIQITDEKIKKIIELSEGHLREAIILLDKYLIVGENFNNFIMDYKLITVKKTDEIYF